MKKLGIGCLVVLVLLAIAGMVGGYLVYQRVYRPAAEYVGSFKELGALTELERSVKNTAAFVEPAGGELSEELVQRFVGVQDAMKTRLGNRLKQLDAKYDELERRKGSDREVSFGDAMTALKDLTSTLVEAKRAQVDALNDAGFSVEEYEWVRNKAYAGLGLIANGLDLKQLSQAAQEGRGQIAASLAEVTEHDRELVRRYEDKLREMAPLAFFGL